jgi:predicted O-methyltransferase YrrM
MAQLTSLPAGVSDAAAYHAKRIVNRALDRSLRHHRDQIAMQQLAPLIGAYVPWSIMAMRPSAVTTILNDIVVNRRESIVECGAGISTLYIGRVLAQLDRGHLHTVEDDPEWAAVVQESLTGAGIDSRVTLTAAPLGPGALAGGGARWYDEATVAALPADAIDLLVVDGPVAADHERRHARYPALPAFAPRLAPSCTVILDDIGRRGEQQVVERWEREFGFRFDRRFTNGGIALATRGGGFAVSP